MRFLRPFLLPISFIYSAVVFLRNRLYDLEFLKSSKGAISTLVIGNLATGGTGKTPHAEYLLRNLSAKTRIAFLSRGYGRNTNGFQLADISNSATDIGDEPDQIRRKFPAIPVAVCENRLEGIIQLKSLTKANLVILDDAFQHRKLIGDLNILLVDYQHPWWRDFTLPAGNLRDNVFEKRRADLIIVTKCPESLSQHEIKDILRCIKPSKKQEVYFTKLKYSAPIQYSGIKSQLTKSQHIIGLAGIAQPELFETHLNETYNMLKFHDFKDHHIFSHVEIRTLWNECGKFAKADVVLVTTEKDMVKLAELSELVDIPIFYIPIEVEFLQEEAQFLRSISARLSFHDKSSDN